MKTDLFNFQFPISLAINIFLSLPFLFPQKWFFLSATHSFYHFICFWIRLLYLFGIILKKSIYRTIKIIYLV
jgi:hypothetical protein